MTSVPRFEESAAARDASIPVVRIYDHLSPAGRAALQWLTSSASSASATATGPMQTQSEKQVFDVRFRPPTEGPELRMLEQFCSMGLPNPTSSESLSILVEPRVENAFPDLVAVYWDRSIVETWSSARRDLTKVDIRVLHYLHGVSDGVGVDALIARFRAKGMKRSVERLLEANVVREVDGELSAQPLKEIFSLRRVICIEAKVASPSRALEQAIRCTWFASDVYLLLPNLPSDDHILRTAAVHGVGVALPDRPLDVAPVPATPRALPSSYASWLFNEWVWRLSESRQFLALEHAGR